MRDITPAPATAPKKPKAPAGRAAPKKPAATRGGRDGLNTKTQAVLEVVRAGGDWMRPSEIAAGCNDGRSPSTIRKGLQTLLRRGLIEGQGATVNRRYRAVGGGDSAGKTKGVAVTGMKGGQATQGSLQGRLLEAVGYRPSSVDELAERLELGHGEVAAACDELLLGGDIELAPDGRYRAA